MFNVEKQYDDDGKFMAAYVSLITNEHVHVARTVEWVKDQLWADFDNSGHLMGIEILHPGKLTIEAIFSHRHSYPTLSKVIPALRHDLVLS